MSTSTEQYDVAIIGAGPGGYVAAIRAAQLGFRTALIEKDQALGGTCLNVGCIPSKALLDSSEHYHNAHKNFASHGIGLSNLQVNLKQMIARKDEVVKKTTDGIAYLMKKNKVDVFKGLGSFVSAREIKIKGDKELTIKAKNAIIGTGSVPASLPFAQLDAKRIITSTEALDITELPAKMVVIGGGIIGCELGSVYARLGTQVTIIEYLPRIVPGMDADIAKDLLRSLKKLGIDFQLGTKVQEVTNLGNSVKVLAEGNKGEALVFEADYCLMAVGRKPFTNGLGLENIGLKTDERGRIPVDEHLMTAVPGVYAIGDVIHGPMLAHKAEEEGTFVAERLAGQQPHINYLLIPSVVYTWPEGAGVGYTEEQLTEKGTVFKKGVFPFKASGRARASMDQEGFVKVLAHAETDEILGVHMLGPRCADMIAEAVVAMEFRAAAEDIARMSHAHPTFAESLKEACLAATDNRAIHI
jgi:dihydrolipoamide dehydrogenase